MKTLTPWLVIAVAVVGCGDAPLGVGDGVAGSDDSALTTFVSPCPSGATKVPAGADLDKTINGSSARAFCLLGGDYPLSATITLSTGDSIYSNLATGSSIHPASGVTLAKIFTGRADGVHLVNLDIHGARGTSDGRCIQGLGTGLVVKGTVGNAKLGTSPAKVHGCFTNGFGGNDAGMIVDNVEIYGNGDASATGTNSGGLKSSSGFTIEDSWVHDNVGNGIWCDVGCSPGALKVLNNTSTRNTSDGVRLECMSTAAVVSGNTLTGNNTSGANGGHGGFAGVDVANETVENNVFGGNRVAGIAFHDDNRVGGTACGGHAVKLSNDVARNNTMNGDALLCEPGASCN